MTSTEATYQLRKGIQQIREAEGMGAIKMFHESTSAFQAFMQRYKQEAER